LGTAEFVYNNKTYSSTRTLPFKANYGQDPRMGFERRKKGKYKGAEKFIEKMKEIQEEAKVVLEKVQEEIKRYVVPETSSSIQGSLVGLASILIVPSCTLPSRKQKVYWTVEMGSLDKRRETSIVCKS